jgi:hypothetical protein
MRAFYCSSQIEGKKGRNGLMRRGTHVVMHCCERCQYQKWPVSRPRQRFSTEVIVITPEDCSSKEMMIAGVFEESGSWLGKKISRRIFRIADKRA